MTGMNESGGRNVAGMLKMLSETRGGREEVGDWMKEMAIWVIIERIDNKM